jgi:hypothetical protein
MIVFHVPTSRAAGISYIVKEESSFPWLRTDSGYGQ